MHYWGERSEAPLFLDTAKPEDLVLRESHGTSRPLHMNMVFWLDRLHIGLHNTCT